MDYTPTRPGKSESKAPAKDEQTRHKPVVTSSSVKKKSELGKIVSGFIADEATNIKNKTMNDIIIPTIRDTIWSVITSSLEMLLYGGTSRFSKPSGHSGPYAAPYINYSSKKNRDRDRDRVAEPRTKDQLDPDEIVFRTEREARDVLDNLKDDIDDYGLATLLSFYDLANRAKNAPFTADRYGWTRLDRAEVLRLRGGGGYIIKFPKPTVIER